MADPTLTYRSYLTLRACMAGTDPLEAGADDVVRTTRDFMEQLVAVRGSLRQQDVAERMGVSQPTVAAFERYDANPTLATIQRYAVAVGARLTMSAHDALDPDEERTWAEWEARG